MDDAKISAWARTFAEELRVAGEPGFIDRVIGKHLTTLAALKESVGWGGVANILKQAGVRREDGITPLSEDQLRTSYRRMRLRSETSRHKGSNTRETLSRVQSRAARLPPKPVTNHVLPQAHTQIRANPLSKDVSDSEVASALGRINKIGSKSLRRKP
jgi:hypothetical protein